MSGVRVVAGVAGGFLAAVVLHFVFSLIMGNILWVESYVWGVLGQEGIAPPQDFVSWKDQAYQVIFAGWKFYLLGATIGLLATLVLGAMRRRPEEYPV